MRIMALGPYLWLVESFKWKKGGASRPWACNKRTKENSGKAPAISEPSKTSAPKIDHHDEIDNDETTTAAHHPGTADLNNSIQSSRKQNGSLGGAETRTYDQHTPSWIQEYSYWNCSSINLDMNN